MSFFEQYAMCVPLFAPSIHFVTYLHLEYSLVLDINHCPMCGKLSQSPLPAHPAYNGSARVFNTSYPSKPTITLDPNRRNDTRAARHWLQLADYYTLPHVVHFSSVEELVDILQKMWLYPSQLYEIHTAMKVTNRKRLKSLLRYWRRRLVDIAESLPQRPE